jgi:hypothetical protein
MGPGVGRIPVCSGWALEAPVAIEDLVNKSAFGAPELMP